MSRTLKLMPDYGCSPLWVYDGDDLVSNPEPAAFPWTSDLVERVNAWRKEFDQSLNQDDPANSGFVSLEHRRAFAVTGEQLGREIQSQLGEGWHVRYYNVLTGCVTG